MSRSLLTVPPVSRLSQVMRPRLAPLALVTPYLERMEAHGIYALGGPLSRQLESRHAERLGVEADQVVAVNSATAGLTGALAVSGRREWTAPAFAFPAAGHAIINAGCRLTLRDVDATSWRVTARAGESALLGVLPFGTGLRPQDWADSDDVIVDAAASLGAQPTELGWLPKDWTVVFSLNATKVMPCGEGGLVVCGDATRAAEIRRWAHFRLDADRAATGPGANALLPETSAAYALAALDDWETERQEWRSARELANAATHRLGLPGPPDDGADAHPYWIVRLDTADRMRSVETALATTGIASRRWWGPAMNRMPAFADSDSYPVAEGLADTVLGLPMWRGITAEEIDLVAAIVQAGLDSTG